MTMLKDLRNGLLIGAASALGALLTAIATAHLYDWIFKGTC